MDDSSQGSSGDNDRRMLLVDGDRQGLWLMVDGGMQGLSVHGVSRSLWWTRSYRHWLLVDIGRSAGAS